MITTDTEKEFFEAFEIKPVWYNCDYYKIYKEYCYKKDEECKNCKLDVNFRAQYPSITTEKLLYLVILVCKYFEDAYFGESLDEVKDKALSQLISISSVQWVKEKVQKIFEG
jgi:hypothetical protein